VERNQRELMLPVPSERGGKSTGRRGGNMGPERVGSRATALLWAETVTTGKKPNQFMTVWSGGTSLEETQEKGLWTTWTTPLVRRRGGLQPPAVKGGLSKKQRERGQKEGRNTAGGLRGTR